MQEDRGRTRAACVAIPEACTRDRGMAFTHLVVEEDAFPRAAQDDVETVSGRTVSHRQHPVANGRIDAAQNGSVSLPSPSSKKITVCS